MHKCYTKCDPKDGPDRFKCFKTCAYPTCVKLSIITSFHYFWGREAQAQGTPRS